jgi:hypothetical protein
MSGHKGGFDKYKVIRTDSGEPVDGFFLLRPVTDTAARIAIAAYAEATHNPRLAKDLRTWLDALRRGEDVSLVEAVAAEENTAHSDSVLYCPKEIRSDERIFLLNQPIPCRFERDAGLWVLVYDPLHIRAYAKSHAEAISEFAQEFTMLFDEFYFADDAGLTGDAIKLKNHLHDIFTPETMEGDDA